MTSTWGKEKTWTNLVLIPALPIIGSIAGLTWSNERSLPRPGSVGPPTTNRLGITDASADHRHGPGRSRFRDAGCQRRPRGQAVPLQCKAEPIRHRFCAAVHAGL